MLKGVKRQYKVDWCKNIKHLPFDFIIDDRKIIIELDGKQHFEQIDNWIPGLVSPFHHIEHHNLRDKHYAAPIFNIDKIINDE